MLGEQEQMLGVGRKIRNIAIYFFFSGPITFISRFGWLKYFFFPLNEIFVFQNRNSNYKDIDFIIN